MRQNNQAQHRRLGLWGHLTESGHSVTLACAERPQVPRLFGGFLLFNVGVNPVQKLGFRFVDLIHIWRSWSVIGGWSGASMIAIVRPLHRSHAPIQLGRGPPQVGWEDGGSVGDKCHKKQQEDNNGENLLHHGAGDVRVSELCGSCC